jgi:hypothetical protein
MRFWSIVAVLVLTPFLHAAEMANRASIYRPRTTRPTATEPIKLGPGPHLFIDDLLIAESHNVRRVVNPPVRGEQVKNPIITGKEDGCFQPYMTVLRDTGTGKFRIWYGARTAEKDPSQSRLAYMESADGIAWQSPHRLLETPYIQFGVSVLDEGPAFVDPRRRYKLAWWAPPAPAKTDELPGLKLASSPDGFSWTQMTRPGAASDVIVPHNHDINSIFRDPIRNRYVTIMSTYVEDAAWRGKRRVTTQSVSDDLLNWATPWRVVVPDPTMEHEQTQFYSMDGFLVRGPLIIGMAKVLRDDLKADNPPDPPDAYGIGHTALAWSRDGEHWTREREPFFDRDPRRGAWDHAHAWIDEQVAVRDEVYLYYGGYARGHKVNRFEERQIGLARMKRDRYVAREAGAEGGTIVTPPIVIDGAELTMNADVSDGDIRVQLRESDGTVIEGAGFADFESVKSVSSLEIPLRWKADRLEALRGRAVKLEFELRSARIYAIGVR